MQLFRRAVLKKSILILTLILGISALTASAQDHVTSGSDSLEYLFVITGDTGTYEDGKLTLDGTPIIVFNYLGSTREVGHFLVGTFIEIWDKNSSAYNASPPSGTLSVLSEKGSGNAVIAVSSPSATLSSITFDVKVLEGEVPASFNASSFFLKLKVDEKLKTQN